jgi:hypothetical protein
MPNFNSVGRRRLKERKDEEGVGSCKCKGATNPFIVNWKLEFPEDI